MRFSGFMDKLNEKYRGVTAPVKKKLHINEKILFIVAAAAVVIIITLNILDSTGVIKYNPEDGISNINWPTMLPKDANTTPNPLSMNIGTRAKILNIKEKRINQPSVFGSELLFSAGDGPIEKPVLRTLYHFDTQTEVLTKLATSTMKDGEIYEAYLSESWIVWLDTDHKGNNIIFKMNRKELPNMPVGTPTEVSRVQNNSPKLSLGGNNLAYIEQQNDNSNILYIFDLISGEDIAVEEFGENNYALSAPYILGNQVIYAIPDPDQSDEDKKLHPKSLIKTVTLKDSVSQDHPAPDQPEPTEPPPDTENPPSEITPDPNATEPPEDTSHDLKFTLYNPDGYVHEPMSNGEVVIWIDKNKAPDSSLYMSKNGGAPELIHKNVTSYSIGADFIVYNYNQMVFAYIYSKNVTIQLSQDEKPAILPQAQGNVVVWEDKTPGNEKDIFKYNVLD